MRAQKTVLGATTVYIYSNAKVIAEYTGGALSKEYIYSGSQLLATVAGNIASYQYPDHLSTRLETDSSGNVTRTFGHLPFGEAWYETGAANKWKFTSYERDSESNLDYALNRFDSSRLGRFLSPDLLSGSLTAPQSLNRYSYVLNDPIGLVDPLGTGPCDPEDYSPEDCAALTAFQNHGLGAGAGGAGDSNNSYLIFRPGRQDNGGDGNSYAASFAKALVKDFSLTGPSNDPRPSCLGIASKGFIESVTDYQDIQEISNSAYEFYQNSPWTASYSAGVIPVSKALRNGLSRTQWFKLAERQSAKNFARTSTLAFIDYSLYQGVKKEWRQAIAGDCK